MSWYRQQLEDWLSTKEIVAETVFDIGGSQGDVRPRLKKCVISEYKVLDLPDWNLEKTWDKPEQANIVFCLEVFEYLIEPVNAIKNIANVLKPNGRAYVTFAFVYPHHNELELDSLRYTETSIIRLADIAKLDITNIWYRTDKSGLLQSMFLSDGMKMAKQYNNHNVTGFIVEFTK